MRRSLGSENFFPTLPLSTQSNLRYFSYPKRVSYLLSTNFLFLLLFILNHVNICPVILSNLYSIASKSLMPNSSPLYQVSTSQSTHATNTSVHRNFSGYDLHPPRNLSLVYVTHSYTTQ